MNESPTRSRRLLTLVTVAGTAVLAALTLSGPAVAAKQESCGDQVIADWYDNQRVDKIYPIHCYRDAIQKLPPDIRDYTGAADAINRALTYAKAGEPDPGGAAGGPAGPGSPRTGPYKPVAYRTFAEERVAVADPGGTTASGKPTSTSGPSSVPIPLIVLAGLAGVLLVAGGAGYVARRVQSRRGGPPPPASP